MDIPGICTTSTTTDKPATTDTPDTRYPSLW